jgi:hypothetical protein
MLPGDIFVVPRLAKRRPPSQGTWAVQDPAWADTVRHVMRRMMRRDM